MCIALTKQRPSITPLRATSCSILGVMLMNPRRPGTSNQRCSVSDFISGKLKVGSTMLGARSEARLVLEMKEVASGLGFDDEINRRNQTHEQIFIQRESVLCCRCDIAAGLHQDPASRSD